MPPYNGVGTFTLVSGNPVVTGQTISSTVQNNTMSDFATGLSTCLTKDGQQTVSANIPMSSFKFTGLGNPSLAGDSLAWGGPVSVTTILASGALTFQGLMTASGGGAMTGAWDFTGGSITVPTQTIGDQSTKAASTAFVVATSLSASLPGQLNNGGRVITTDGTNASWTNSFCNNDPAFGMTF